MPQSVRNLLAAILLVGALGVGVPMMLQGESQVDLKLNTDQGLAQISQVYDVPSTEVQELPTIKNMVNNGLKPYFLGMGLIFVMAAIAFILVDGSNQLTTLKSDEEEVA